jgi:hypothetical protein
MKGRLMLRWTRKLRYGEREKPLLPASRHTEGMLKHKQNKISHRYKALVKFQEWLAEGQE